MLAAASAVTTTAAAQSSAPFATAQSLAPLATGHSSAPLAIAQALFAAGPSAGSPGTSFCRTPPRPIWSPGMVGSFGPVEWSLELLVFLVRPSDNRLTCFDRLTCCALHTGFGPSYILLGWDLGSSCIPCFYLRLASTCGPSNENALACSNVESTSDDLPSDENPLASSLCLSVMNPREGCSCLRHMHVHIPQTAPPQAFSV